MSGESGHHPAGWYPDPSGLYRLRFWDPEAGWSATAVSGAIDAAPRAEEPRSRRSSTSGALLIGTGVALLLLLGFVAALASRAEWPMWLVDPPLPAAPPLPPGSHMVQAIEGSDSDAGWIGIRGSAFTSDWSDDTVHDFYGREYPDSQGWREVDPSAPDSESGLDYCWARTVNGEGDWESVLLTTGSSPGRFVIMRADIGDGFWPLQVGESPTMEGCTNSTAWASPSWVFDWLNGAG